MNFTLENFKKINKEFSRVAKLLSSAAVDLNYYYNSDYSMRYTLKYNSLGFPSLEKMHEYSKINSIVTIGFKSDNAFNDRMALYRAICSAFPQGNRTAAWITNHHAASAENNFKNLKLVPESIPRKYCPLIIQNDPFEATEGDYTYRILVTSNGTNDSEIGVVARNDEPLYDYLDKGYYVMCLESPQGRKFVVSDMYDVNTAHIFMMCELEPELTEHLQNGCFINSYEAEMTRLKMSRKLKNKGAYAGLFKTVDNDYQKNTTLIVVGKLASGDVEKTTIGNVLFTKTSATYEHVRIEADNLLDVLYKNLNFNQEFDIYTVADIYSKHIDTQLDVLRGKYPSKKKDKAAAEVEEADAEAEEDNSKKDELPTFKINDIEIVAAVNSTGQRFVNNIRINKEEVGKVIHRASCHRTPEDYKLFLKSISRMSIKWHDIISNGLQVKIHDMTREEYVNPLPSPSAPALKFYIDKDDKYIKLHIDENRGVRTSLGRLIKRVETINKRTDNNSSYVRDDRGWGHRVYRTNEWASTELIESLIACTTFKKKVTQEDGTVQEVDDVLITKDDLKKLLSVVNAQKKTAILRSKEFLSTAVKLTGATEIEFMGKKAYKVRGGLREYAVVIENAKVYDYETKQYRCIVNDRHYAGAGYDDIAARLLALKNDSVMQANIRTLAGQAQPQHENTHNDYRPERDLVDTVDKLVEKATL